MEFGTPRKRSGGGGGVAAFIFPKGAAADPALQKPRAAPRASVAASTEKRKLLVAGALGTVALVALVVGLAAGLALKSRRASLLAGAGPSALDADYCGRLPDAAQAYCTAYITSAGSERFPAASQWHKMSSITYECSGVKTTCLDRDLKGKGAGSSCRPLAEGAACSGGGDRKCRSGVCGGLAAWEAEQQAAAKARAAQEAEARAAAAASGRASNPAPAPGPSPAPLPPSAPAPARGAGWQTFAAEVHAGSPVMRVPETFLATSHEWDRITDYADNLEAFAPIFREFGPSPILRMGGASQDFLTEPPRREIWEAMAKMHAAFSARFLIGLPLWRPDSAAIASRMMKMADEYLPKKAIVGFELGNEPEFWPTSVGGYAPQANTTFVPGFDAYASYFGRTATKLNPCGPNTSPKLSGPGWGNVNTIDAAWLATQAKAPGARCYMRELSVHYYPYVNNDTIDARGLLDQGLQDFGLSKFQWLLGVAKAVRLPMRISETNSLYGGGRAGLSDTMAGTVWCADALFAFAQAGASGFHFHWGFGGRPLLGGQPNTGVQTNFWEAGPDKGKPYPSVHAPWYGYLLFRHATAGAAGGYSDATLVSTTTRPGGCRANIKVWGLRPEGGGLRVAVLNKDMDTPCNVELTLDGDYCASEAAVSRLLPGAQGMASKDGITWRGRSYDGSPNGLLKGAPSEERVAPVPLAGADGRCTVTVPMPAASGAVVEAAWGR
ncbi:hypothetical protein Rsub_11023 [Raphidocelis subcapitata]|uniref:Beta-glucuronidase C-terminal domain-containing protein n=1 Tax=Raphidocelis subcapitata TaxID=307507 RepID=A0A2V0PC04_9CHLO|nr:hypothetical protein Rsub_11023 [Raphidocelis subcapitata]|eukprot:GBF97376.1 hypothetical protein Rsub_11023 [Raphidocelis subcapitata]